MDQSPFSLPGPRPDDPYRASNGPAFEPLSDQWGEAKPKPRDLKRTFLIVGLGGLSWVATYVGMLELIEANMGDLPLIHKAIIGFSVAMLMTMIVWLLDQLFKPQPFITRLSYVAGYIFLSLISIGFGFGFYWKVLESRSEASRSAESAVGQVQNSLQGASTRLEQLQATLGQLTALSTQKAQIESLKGTSCPNSRPGDGPRRKLREDDAQRFSFASEFVRGRVDAVKTDLSALNGDLVKIASADPTTFDPKTGTRNEFMKALGRKLDLTASTFNAFRTDPQLRQLRGDFAERAEKTTFADGKTAFSCPDAQLQTALRGVVKAIDQLPELERPTIAAVEGSEATIEAFRRLTTTFYGALSFKLPPSADELRELQKKAVQSIESPTAEFRALSNEQAGLSKRDYVPLAVAVFVDICLLLVSMVSRPADRLGSLVPKMQAAERGPVIQILSRFNDIHRDRQIRENFELFRHVVFDMNGDYFVAVPLDAPARLNPEQREALRVEAQLLSNLFASFEKEKIFKRTLLPMAGTIRKRLARQGSKFAGSEAFRVYKFADGAWSDIILGAVMGAAKRIESEKRARQSVTASFANSSPAAAPVSPIPQSIQPEIERELRTAPRAVPPSDIRHDDLLDRQTSRTLPTSPSAFGPYAHRAMTELTNGHGVSPSPARSSPDAQVRAYGPRPKPMPEADVIVQAANSNTAPPMRRFDSASDMRMPAILQRAASAPLSAETPDRVDVTLERDTISFSIPTTAAALPKGLAAALRKAVDGDVSATPPPMSARTLEINARDLSADRTNAAMDPDADRDGYVDDWDRPEPLRRMPSGGWRVAGDAAE